MLHANDERRRILRMRLASGIGVLIAAAACAQGLAQASGHSRVTIKAPGAPLHIAYGDGSVWVAGHRGAFAYRIDPKTNKTIAVNLGQGTCWPPAFAGGYIWFGGCESGPTVKVDPKTNRAVGQFNGVTPLGAAGSLWILNPDFTRLLRVDPQSGIVLARISPKIDMTQAGGTAGYGSGSVWLYSDTAVSRVDPGTNHVTAVIPLPGGKISGGFPGGYSYGGYGVFAAGRFWVANPAGVYVINPATNAAAKLPLKIQPFSQAGDIYIAAGAGSIWVRTSGNSIARLSPSDGHAIARYPATGGGGGIAVANGALWVANFGNDTVWREPITGSG